MKTFACAACGQSVFFENSQCTQCGALLAYLPDLRTMSALKPVSEGDGSIYVAYGPGALRYRLCRNWIDHAVCNWAVPQDDEDPLCASCRLNGVIPDLGAASAREAWHRVEVAKRRMLQSLLALGLPVESRAQNPKGGLSFVIKAESEQEKVFTGHNDGEITINLAEADDPFREKMRAELGETYRTLLGHFRHEIGHYYWDRLVRDSAWLPLFRRLFGDERRDYGESLRRHYECGPPPDWRERYVSAYATMHPWEDWAESWAHYLHMVSTLHTARSHGLSITQPARAGSRRSALARVARGGFSQLTRGRGRGAARVVVSTEKLPMEDFEGLLEAWIPVTVTLNSLNRAMGRPDAYPFVLSRDAIRKLHFVHDVIEHVGGEGREADGGHQGRSRAMARWEKELDAAEAPAPALV